MKVDEDRLSALLAKDEAKLYPDDVIYLVEVGVWKPSVAEAWAKKNHRGPFSREPNANEFDPLDERYWSLSMTVAWIMGRNPDAVRKCWRRYLGGCYQWIAYPPNPNIPDRNPYKLINPSPNIYNEYAIKRIVNGNKSISLLRNRLESGLISATGINKERVRVHIRNIEWCDLTFSVQSWSYLLLYDTIDDVVEINEDENLYWGNDNLSYKYTRVLLDVPDVLKEFPAGDSLRTKNRPLGLEEVRVFLRREIDRRDGFIDQATAAELVRRIDPTFKRDSVRSLVKSLTGNEKRGPRGKRTQKAAENGEKSSPA